MKTLIATLLATAAGASFAAAPTAALNHDAATYNNVKQKADAAYQAAAAKCPAMSGNDKNVCMAEARLARTQAETNALSKYYNTPAGRQSMRTVVANAEYDVAKTRCDGKSGADKDDCLNNAKSVHTAALADAKADRASTTVAATATTASGSTGATGATGAGSGLVSSTATADPVKAGAVDKCAQAGGDAKTGCVIETKPSAVRDSAANAAANAADNTRAAASTAASKTRDAAATATEKTKDVAATAAEKTKEVAQTAVEKTKQAASTVVDKTQPRVVAADTAITAKVKAGLVKETKLDSLGIHVETEKGVVMLSGFVNTKDEAEKAVQVAKNVDGVANVRSAIQVK